MDHQIESILQGGQFKKLLEEQSLVLRQKYDLKKAELDILYFLSRCGEYNTSTDIHHQLLMNRGHISQAVDSLIKKQYIVAIPDQNDRRDVHYELLASACGMGRDKCPDPGRNPGRGITGISFGFRKDQGEY